LPKQKFASVDSVLYARRLYESDYSILKARNLSRPTHRICITTIFALDFEKHRILDWIAYHNLLGVDCFLLFHDHSRSDVSNPVVRDVYDKLSSSPLVTMIQATALSDRTMKPEVMRQWFTAFPAKYVAPIDVDEFIVLTLDDETGSDAPDLYGFLQERFAENANLGIYMNRWDYGTSGFRYAPTIQKEPEFVMLKERWGAAERVIPEKELGKMILNIDSGVAYNDVHHWLAPEQPSGSMMFPNGTAMCPSDAIQIVLPRTKQPLSLNHYATGSLTQCIEKAQASQFSRRDQDECERLHPGTAPYDELRATYGMVFDDVLVKYANLTTQRRDKLFG
jgi:hypothetical protein